MRIALTAVLLTQHLAQVDEDMPLAALLPLDHPAVAEDFFLGGTIRGCPTRPTHIVRACLKQLTIQER